MKDFGWTPEQRRKIWDERISPALGEVVLLKDEMHTAKLLGLAEDSTDFYYIYGIIHSGVVMSSCVSDYIRINEIEDYDREVRIFDLNFKFEEESVAANTEMNLFFREEELP